MTNEQKTNGKTLIMVVTPEIDALYKEYQEVRKDRGYDARTNVYKTALAKMEDIQNKANELVRVQAENYLKENDLSLEYEPDIKLRLEAYIGFEYRDLEPRAYLKTNKFEYHSDCMDLVDKSVKEIKAIIAEQIVKYNTKNAKEDARIDVADKLLQEVKEDVTYKNSSWRYDEDKSKKWDGSELSSEYTIEGERYSEESAKIKMNIREKDKIDCEFRVRTKFKSVEEAKKFWDEAKRFVESQETKFVKIRRD